MYILVLAYDDFETLHVRPLIGVFSAYDRPKCHATI